MRKSPDAFRTISEVAQDLDLPQHVLRFWETRFSQIKPMKRGGGRRYYRPDDIDLLKGIRHLLYDEGYTIKGVQRILKEQGVRHVIDSIAEFDDGSDAVSANGVGAPHATHPQDYHEPNQLEVTRPPLVAPRHPTSQQPVQNAQNSQAAEPMHVQPPAAHLVAQPMQSAPAAAYTAPPATAPVTSPSPAVQMPQATTAVQALHQAAAHPIPVQPEPPHIQDRTPTPTAFAPQFTDQPQQAPTQPIPTTVPAAASGQAHASAQAAPQIHQHATAQIAQKAQGAPTPHMPESNHQGVALPRDLATGDPKFVSGEAASISVSEAQRVLGEQAGGGSLFNRLRSRMEEPAKVEKTKAGMARDDIRRLQSTLFELLECKRILDQARSDD